MERPLRCCSFESRRGDEMAKLIERFGGEPFVAPSMQEIPLSENPLAFDFAVQLLAGNVHVVVFMTGVGTEALFAALASRQQADAVQTQLSQCVVVARGPKPSAALSKRKIRVDLKADEPNTWHEVVKALRERNVPLDGKTIAIQEYGAPSQELYDWLATQGARVMPVPVYRWALPDDIGPLQEAVRRTIAGEFEVLLWTSAQQVNHVAGVAEDLRLAGEWRAAANRCVIGSIGPTASERLREFDLMPDLEPSHPKMAHLIRETLEQANAILARKPKPN